MVDSALLGTVGTNWLPVSEFDPKQPAEVQPFVLLRRFLFFFFDRRVSGESPVTFRVLHCRRFQSLLPILVAGSAFAEVCGWTIPQIQAVLLRRRVSGPLCVELRLSSLPLAWKKKKILSRSPNLRAKSRVHVFTDHIFGDGRSLFFWVASRFAFAARTLLSNLL